MKYTGFEQYRREVMLPGGWRNCQPGVWARTVNGEQQVYLPWTYYAGKQHWQHDAEAGLAPDGSPITEVVDGH